MERAQRRVLVQYPKRQTARGAMQQERSHLPIKLNTAGVIPPIFASSLLLMPLTVLQMAGAGDATGGGSSDWLITRVDLAPAWLAALSAAVRRGDRLLLLLLHRGAVQREETSEQLKRHGGFIPGIRPGKATETYFDYLLNRITVVGAAYLVLICLIPEILFSQAGVPFYLGGTSLLIVVNVTMDTVSQIQSHLIAHQYGDLIKKAKLKGGKRR